MRYGICSATMAVPEAPHQPMRITTSPTTATPMPTSRYVRSPWSAGVLTFTSASSVLNCSIRWWFVSMAACSSSLRRS